MSADVPRPSGFTFGRGSPPGESLVYPTTSHLDPDKERLIHDWLDADGEETPARLDNIETTGPLLENTEENPVRTSENEDPKDLSSTPGQLSTSTKPPETLSTALTKRTAEKSVVQKSTKQYGWRWEWDPTSRDFIHVADGKKILYAVYQRESDLKNSPEARKPGGEGATKTDGLKSAASYVPQNTTVAGSVSPSNNIHPAPASLAQSTDSDGFVKVPERPDSPESAAGSSSSREIDFLPRQQRPKRPFELPLDDRFVVVAKPKRFFSIGRIFKTPWFEPGGDDAPGQPSDRDWRDECPEFHSTKPIAKFRWFVVVRRRPNHTLCYSITTFGGQGAAKTRRGRAADFVVLYKAEIDPPKPYDEEEITKEPLSVIIEEGEQYISPLARLDCGRIYTVEDNLRVMKIGRIHPESLPLLEECYRDSVLS